MSLSGWVRTHYSCALRRQRGGGRVKSGPDVPACVILSKCPVSKQSVRGDSAVYYATIYKQEGLRYLRTLEFRVINDE